MNEQMGKRSLLQDRVVELMSARLRARVASVFGVLIPSLVMMACISAAESAPNIVFILADDLGWSDVGFNGAKFYETPNIDRLAAAGMRFNDAYSGGPNCLPTRACLISGMYTPRTQIWTPGTKAKGDSKLMKLWVPTRDKGGNDEFPSKRSLEPSVTSIAEVVKQAGYATARFGKWHVGPDTQGFDISDPSGKGAPIGKKFYGNVDVAEWMTDASVKFIEDNQDKPFLLYLCHWDVHTPIRARKNVVAKYNAKLENGRWDREWNTTYAAMIEAVDTSVGRVRGKLEELGLQDNTLFIFSSDNGGLPGVTTNAPLKGGKGSFFEGGVRVPTCMTWPAVVQAGSQCDTPITSVDFLPTFAELSGAPLPKNQPVDGRSIVPLLRGENGLTDRAIFWHYPLYLSGGRNNQVLRVHGTDRLYWRAVPSSMVRKGDWKLIHYFEDDSVKLFHVDQDVSEKRDLATEHPDKAHELFEELKAWQKEVAAAIPTKSNPLFTTR
jgi:arylsulfatase A-like enzyme